MRYVILALTLSSGLFAKDPVCHRCELNREYNKSHPGDFEYYEDYIEAEKTKPSSPKEAPAKETAPK